jgi:hypothetical protein
MKTKFNPKNKKELTYGESLSPAMEITEQSDADQYFQSLMAFTQKALDKEPRKDNATAEEIVKSNLGYWAGYYSEETRARVEKLFHCEHPIFGAIAEVGAPSPKVAFAIGKSMGRKMMDSSITE